MKWWVEGCTNKGETTHYKVSWYMLYDDEKRAIIKRIVAKLILWAIGVGSAVVIYYRF